MDKPIVISMDTLEPRYVDLIEKVVEQGRNIRAVLWKSGKPWKGLDLTLEDLMSMTKKQILINGKAILEIHPKVLILQVHPKKRDKEL